MLLMTKHPAVTQLPEFMKMCNLNIKSVILIFTKNLNESICHNSIKMPQQ